MSTKLLTFCFSLCFCLTTAGAFATPFTSPNGYRLTMPAGWYSQVPLRPGDDADIAANQKVAVRHKMMPPFFQVQFRPDNYPATSASLEEINKGFLSRVRQSSPDLKVLSQTYSTLDGVRAIDCIFTATINGVPLRFHEVLVVKNQKAFTFTGSCPNQVYPKYAAAYAQMLSSVHWKK